MPASVLRYRFQAGATCSLLISSISAPSLLAGRIDVGLIIVPDDHLSRFLTDRTPNFRTAIKHIEARASDLPFRVLAFRHDGTGPALEKMRTNVGRAAT